MPADRLDRSMLSENDLKALKPIIAAVYRVGSHRRVYFKDLEEFSYKRNKIRREALDNVFKRD